MNGGGQARTGTMTEKKRPYTKFYHDIEDALISARLNGTQLAIVLYIQRKTTGWDKEEGECISLTEFHRATGYNRANLSVEIKMLKAAKIIICTKGGTFTKSATWKLNYKLKDWNLKVLVNRQTVSDKETVGSH